MLCMGSIGMDHFTSEPCYHGTILQRNCRKITISCSFSYNSFTNSLGKILEPQHFFIYPNTLYNEVCYKGTVPWLCLHILVFIGSKPTCEGLVFVPEQTSLGTEQHLYVDGLQSHQCLYKVYYLIRA